MYEVKVLSLKTVLCLHFLPLLMACAEKMLARSVCLCLSATVSPRGPWEGVVIARSGIETGLSVLSTHCSCTYSCTAVLAYTHACATNFDILVMCACPANAFETV